MKTIPLRHEPLVSIIIPTYNRADVISRSIFSVLNQSYQNIELIVVDDGSVDATKRVVEQINDRRLKLVSHKRNMGVGAARNTGIEVAKGELIAFQDSDDEWLYGKLEKQVSLFKAMGTQCVLVYCTKIIYGRDKNRVYGKRRVVCVPDPDENHLSGSLGRRLLSGNLISTQTILARTSALRKIGGFDLRLKNSEEWDLCFRLSQIGEFGFVDEPLVNTYIQTDSISLLAQKAILSQLIIINKFKRMGYPTEDCALRLGRLGVNLASYGHFRLGSILIRSAISRNPRNLKNWGRLMKIYLQNLYLAPKLRVRQRKRKNAN